jgi:hypothetical protein
MNPGNCTQIKRFRGGVCYHEADLRVLNDESQPLCGKVRVQRHEGNAGPPGTYHERRQVQTALQAQRDPITRDETSLLERKGYLRRSPPEGAVAHRLIAEPHSDLIFVLTHLLGQQCNHMVHSRLFRAGEFSLDPLSGQPPINAANR